MRGTYLRKRKLLLVPHLEQQQSRYVQFKVQKRVLNASIQNVLLPWFDFLFGCYIFKFGFLSKSLIFIIVFSSPFLFLDTL